MSFKKTSIKKEIIILLLAATVFFKHKTIEKLEIEHASYVQNTDRLFDQVRKDEQQKCKGNH
ncbi:hypothetical protein I2F27_11185 [Acinetobacter sp. B5B]|uniref:hypothetical protein n=1 Tax=Acinetobacter baretiae TaxID=2605383 RepID=UPI0018C24DB5|nr:hypothetical protein [Acinetobacter baretiae]MBF7683882.1 hypothetical protein [Acinetobacter baretiae]